ncbi:MAG: class I SAM-dependent methyltransferase [Ilumatobacteraceae bacterium]
MDPTEPYAVSERWSQWRTGTDLEEYFTRWRRLEASGESPHGEADFIESLHPATVLDAGCGMGRVAIELHRRGIDVVGVDLDDDLLGFAKRSDPSIAWLHDDLATMRLNRRFDIVAMPGNVMVFCRPGDRLPIIRNAVAHLEPGGLLIAGFQLEDGVEALTVEEFDEMCGVAGLELIERWSTWDRRRYAGGSYAVSAHRNACLDTVTVPLSTD